MDTKPPAKHKIPSALTEPIVSYLDECNGGSSATWHVVDKSSSSMVDDSRERLLRSACLVKRTRDASVLDAAVSASQALSQAIVSLSLTSCQSLFIVHVSASDSSDNAIHQLDERSLRIKVATTLRSDSISVQRDIIEIARAIQAYYPRITAQILQQQSLEDKSIQSGVLVTVYALLTENAVKPRPAGKQVASKKAERRKRQAKVQDSDSSAASISSSSPAKRASASAPEYASGVDIDDHEQHGSGLKNLSGDELKSFIRKRNALYSRRMYHRRKNELERLQGQVSVLQDEARGLAEKNSSLEQLLGQANDLVRQFEGYHVATQLPRLNQQQTQLLQQQQQQQRQSYSSHDENMAQALATLREYNAMKNSDSSIGNNDRRIDNSGTASMPHSNLYPSLVSSLRQTPPFQQPSGAHLQMHQLQQQQQQQQRLYSPSLSNNLLPSLLPITSQLDLERLPLPVLQQYVAALQAQRNAIQTQQQQQQQHQQLQIAPSPSAIMHRTAFLGTQSTMGGSANMYNDSVLGSASNPESLLLQQFFQSRLADINRQTNPLAALSRGGGVRPSIGETPSVAEDAKYQGKTDGKQTPQKPKYK